MGCSPDFSQTPEELAEEKRRDRARKLIRTVPLNILTVGDILDLTNCYHPGYALHTWNKRDTDVLVGILERVGKW